MPKEKTQSFDCSGCSTEGVHYDSIRQMWDSELSSNPNPRPRWKLRSQESNKQTPDPSNSVGVNHPRPEDQSSQHWYSKSENYWKKQDPSIEGMLGGLGKLDGRDVAANRNFLDGLRRRVTTFSDKRVLDVGAGIGRVTKHFLIHLFDTVDMLEQNPKYLEESISFIGSAKYKGLVEKRLPCAMQSFHADGVPQLDGCDSGSLLNRYDVIWIQWCIIYLTDDDFVKFLRQCSQCLAPGGVICIKDNVVRNGFVVDNDDSSIMRSDQYLKHIFAKANVEVIRETIQLDFPRDIFPVRTYALRPFS
eukprot:GFKZ01014940.1.p1 GENE.GFKZ01014940.1~~GFKZ01014940.1.p1  ORF type:complete len:304 (-),score=33.49 GFKZ01014940.1:537-1448(-)